MYVATLSVIWFRLLLVWGFGGTSRQQLLSIARCRLATIDNVGWRGSGLLSCFASVSTPYTDFSDACGASVSLSDSLRAVGKLLLYCSVEECQ